MLNFFKQHSYLILLTLLFAASVQLMGISVKNPEFPGAGWSLISRILYPVQKLTHEINETGRYIWRQYVWLQQVAIEREMLALQVKELKDRNSALIELVHENERLRNLLNYHDFESHKGVVSSVIGRDPSNWHRTITIDKGKADGLMTGLPVVAGSGIVGQVISVSSRTAKVLMINDSASSVGAMLQESRSIGVIEGVFKSDELSLSYVENLQDEAVSKGDRVITSGMDGVFPKGLLIGFVSSYTEEAGSLFYNISVTPAADLRRLENVSVLIPDKSISE